MNKIMVIAGWQRAWRALRAAEVLAREGLHEDAVSRAYYATLHAAKAALFIHDIATESHAAVRRMFGLHLIRSGEIESMWSSNLGESLDDRLAADYDASASFSSEEARAGLRAAFAALQGRLVEFGDDDGSLAPAAETDAAAPSPAAPEMSPAAETAEVVLAEEVAEAPSASRAEAVLVAPKAVLTQTETPPAAEVAAAEEAAIQQAAIQETAVQNATQDADAQDDAVLDMIAMEMGAPDPISDDEIAEAVAEQTRLAEPAPIAPAIVAKAPEPVAAAPAPPPVQQVVQPPPPAVAPAPVPAVEVSLGSTIIASGMLRKPVTAANDPLAPIRRMSQAEKIAFFS